MQQASQPQPQATSRASAPRPAEPASGRKPAPKSIDMEGFAREIRTLRKEIHAALGSDDIDHLKKMERWGRIATTVGLATAWMGPNPVSAVGLSLGRSTRWILMHHIGHCGYDRVPDVPSKYTSKVFARGWRRWIDWPDWMVPEAWIKEHNGLHHAHTGQLADPDLVERNSEWIHDWPAPVRWGLLAGLMMTWRPTYYAPNTIEEWLGKEGDEEDLKKQYWQLLIKRCWIPGIAYNFVGIPLLFSPLGPLAVGSALLNSMMAEVLTNMHTFLVVGPNHTGEDLYRFDGAPESRAEHFVRQVLSSTNFATGDDKVDALHLYLNYQIEHHLFPDVPMLQYRKVQPKVKALCEKYGLPYVQESVFKRFAKMAQVFVGNVKMPFIKADDFAN